MGCCSVTQRNAAGIDEVGPDEIELLELSGEPSGLWNVGEPRLQPTVKSGKHDPPPCRPTEWHQEQKVVLWGRNRDELHHRIYSHQPIKDWEGQPAHTYGDVAHSSLVILHNSYTPERPEHFLVLFSFHLLILSVDHSTRDFVYEGILPLSGLTFRPLSWKSDSSQPLDGFEVSSAMVDPKVFICPSAAEVTTWMDHLESTPRPLSPAHGPLSYLLPCDEPWKREELKKFLLQMPILRWQGTPIQRMGEPAFISTVWMMNTQKRVPQERLMVLYTEDVLLLSADHDRLYLAYQGRLARRSVQAVEHPPAPGHLEFELKGELMEPVKMSCLCLQDYHTWLFHLKQPRKISPDPSPLLPKPQRTENTSRGLISADHRCHPNGGLVDSAVHRRHVF